MVLQENVVPVSALSSCGGLSLPMKEEAEKLPFQLKVHILTQILPHLSLLVTFDSLLFELVF